MATRTTQADALHQAGQTDQARRLFVAAEAIQAERQPKYPRLYSLSGFRYCDLLLADAEYTAWRRTLDPQVRIPDLADLQDTCDQAAEHADRLSHGFGENSAYWMRHWTGSRWAV